MFQVDGIQILIKVDAPGAFNGLPGAFESLPATPTTMTTASNSPAAVRNLLTGFLSLRRRRGLPVV